ncbi:hypothetical protein PFNF135_03742 [Plasmodium falciparum NF135/5.C10]|uniref:GAF domain-containing protein n=1 Tax=Plasmodium falciparum NF135/5.C10 TaxID=1036726 RepID=W4IGL9_PLAFA|nr:hypothetical protein PFNF135_03742 [Plasmodium falciparum NF135/5.C10]
MYVKHFSKFPNRTFFYKQKKRKYIFFTSNKYFVHNHTKINSCLYHKNIHKNYYPFYKIMSPIIYKKKITHVNNIQSIDTKGKKKILEGYKEIDTKGKKINKINIMDNILSMKNMNRINNTNTIIYIINKRLFNNNIKYIYSNKKKKKNDHLNYFNNNMRQIRKILFLQKYSNILQTKKYIIKSIMKHNKIKYHHHIYVLHKLSNHNYTTNLFLSLNDGHYIKKKKEQMKIQQRDQNKIEIKKNINPPYGQYNNSHDNIYNNNNNKYDHHQNYHKPSEKMIEEKIHDKNEMNIKRNDLLLVALSGCIPFICFGFVDNSFMIISGDLFDSSFCTYLGFSTMAAAGLGNLTSDVLGIFIGGYIEKIIVYIGFPKINLTNKQLKMNRTRRYYYSGSAIDHNNMNFNSIYNHNIFQTSLNVGLISHVYQNKKTINYQKNDKNINTNVRNTFKYKHNNNNNNDLPDHININTYDNTYVEKIVNDTHIIIDKNKIDIQQILAVPVLSIDGNVEAVIAVINSEDNLSFNHNDVVFLNMLSSHLSYDLENEEDLSDMLK